MRDKTGDLVRLKHISDAVNQIEEYISNIDITAFRNNSMMIFACVKQLEIIGEASNHLTEKLKAKHDTVEWRQIIGMRNVFVHEYFGIDVTLVWDIIQNDLQHFKHTINIMLEETDSKENK